MPVNPYDDRKVSLRRPHGNDELDIVRASYTRRKANVTRVIIWYQGNIIYIFFERPSVIANNGIVRILFVLC